MLRPDIERLTRLSEKSSLHFSL